ncbi:hypothetical protein SPRG_08306 [Saprolegnia parasitica CBS 223.65]|uniref:Methyltransferase domain-containing protein n=1 Tax=Saprolegnia parasitica (strain CBS 223.65) TaxID=695850 RepID=A0A067CI79_SAPPC|nr:hypothetical protein SPRG_08306 [Saprolegnia parasitica CBS 223.65]KDO26231.1 hypothetical protein SPRG_08306 [Saprolegnia parasitica CBS 223.65]|eukprot:XP_012202940.1 hypothetical protein SPRG_08306 [Saprolegnia parasitica CBS 223.65]
MDPERKAAIRQLVVAAAKAKFQARRDAAAVSIAPYSPSPMAMVHGVWDRLAPMMSVSDHVVELGCGDGRWILEGVKRFGCSAMGVEWDPQVAQRAKAQAATIPGAIEIRIEDMLAPTFRLPQRTSLVIVYAFAETLNLNVKALLAQCDPRTKVLSVGFRVHGWQPQWTLRFNGLNCYYYELAGHDAGIGDSKR